MKRIGSERANPIRGVFMVLAACLAFLRGWQIHFGRMALLAYGLGAAALALAVWHFARRPPKIR